MSRDAICLAADARKNLSAGATPEAFDAAVFPHDTASDARSMGRGQSCCGTCCESILCTAEVDGTLCLGGVTRDWLRAPYALRQGGPHAAIVFQRELGKARGCWVDASHLGPERPIAGDMIEVEGPTHVLTVVWASDDGVELETIEGGQPDKITGHNSAILRKRRHLSVRGGRLYCDARRVAGWLRAGDLPCRA